MYTILSPLAGLGLGEFGPDMPAQQALVEQQRRQAAARMEKEQYKEDDPDKRSMAKRKDLRDP